MSEGMKNNDNMRTAAEKEAGFLSKLSEGLIKRFYDKGVNAEGVAAALKNSISVEVLVNNLAELFRASKSEIENEIKALGFKDMLDQYSIKNVTGAGPADSTMLLCAKKDLNPYKDLFRIHSVPEIYEPLPVSEQLKKTFEDLFRTISASINSDPFIQLYRQDVLGYYNEFMSGKAPLIKDEIKKLFGEGYPKYMVTTGIGANEQFNHYMASLNNADENRRVDWLIINSPKRLADLPKDATTDNTLFLEFSRSSITEETVKIHEYTPRNAKRIVFSNSGPLKELGQRDGNLILELPDKVSGRFGRNKTPILLAPMLIAGMDTDKYWNDIEGAIKSFDITDTDSLPFVIAKFLLVNQKLSSRNFIYLGCNDGNLSKLADEFIQFWNEGVNKGGNDLLVSSFFGLPRDSHMNLEGILGNSATKMALFLLKTGVDEKLLNPMVSHEIDPINPEHRGLKFGDEEVILAVANYRRISEKMPTFMIEVNGKSDTRLSAVLGQLFSDVTYIYSRLAGIDPGSNPEVKFVRERSASLLSESAKKLRESKLTISEVLLSND